MKQIVEKLDLIKAEIDEIKKSILDYNLSEDDVQALNEAEAEHKQNKTTSL